MHPLSVTRLTVAVPYDRILEAVGRQRAVAPVGRNHVMQDVVNTDTHLSSGAIQTWPSVHTGPSSL